MDYNSNPFFICNSMRYSNFIGVAACVFLVLTCFTPWVYISSIQATITGFNTKGTNFGNPGLMHVIVCCFAIIFFLVEKAGAKRANLFFCAFNLAWSFRNFLLLTHCEAGECPEKKIGIYLTFCLSFLMLIMSFLPDIKTKAESETVV